jgi:DNA-binding NtrC family response regulator
VGQENVLLVHHDPALLESMAKTLNYRGHTVDTAVNGLEAVCAIHGRPPSCVLIELAVLDRDGDRVINELRRRDLRVPVLVMASEDEAGDWNEEHKEFASDSPLLMSVFGEDDRRWSARLNEDQRELAAA